MFGKGISKEGDILDLAVKCDLVSKSGAWFAYNGDKIGQGRENAKQFLIDNPQIKAEVDRKVREHYGVGDNTDKTVSEQSDDSKTSRTRKKTDTEE